MPLQTKTIQDVLDGLSPTDARRSFWEKMRNLIRNRDFDVVLMKLLDHRDDRDFHEQVEIVSQAILDRHHNNRI